MDLTKFKDTLTDALTSSLDFAVTHYKDIGSFGLFTDNHCNHLIVVANTGKEIISTCAYELWSEDFISDGLPQDTINKLEDLDKLYMDIFQIDGTESDDFVFPDAWLNTQKKVFEICVEVLADLNKKTDHNIIMGFDPFEYSEDESIRFFNIMNPNKKDMVKHLLNYLACIKE